MKSPELLSPAGTFRNMQFAYAYGADAVYAGQPRYSLRVRNNDFKLDRLAEGIDYAHQRGKLFFVASNIAPHNAKVRTYLQDMAPVIEMQPDALIMSDPGLIMMVRERWPDQVIHLSVQANVVNYAAVRFWQQLGIQRIILSRELSLEEIAEIRAECPDIELETFVHGALCIAYSGRCLLSGYFNHRDPNQGTCTNACRWKYNTHAAQTDATGDLIPLAPATGEWSPEQASDSVSAAGSSTAESSKTAGGEAGQSPLFALLEEANRPGELMPVYEDEHGTYIMNSKDLRAVQHVERLTQMGIDSLKIEGRTKSHYYVARTAQVYRQAIDDAVAGRPFNRDLMQVLDNLANRGYTEGFYRRHVHDAHQNYATGNSLGLNQQFVGEVLPEADEHWLTLEVKNKFELGDTLELMTPQGNRRFRLEALENARNHQAMTVAPGTGYRVKIPRPALPANADLNFALLMRDLAD